MNTSIDRSLTVVVGVSWPVMVSVGASLPETPRGWFASGLQLGVALIVGLGRLIQGLVGSLGADVPLVEGFVGLSPVLVGLCVGSVLVAVVAKPVARWAFENAAISDG